MYTFILLEPTPNYVDESINTVLKIQESDLLGDILVFLTGKEEIMQAVYTLGNYNVKNINDKYVFLIFLLILVVLFWFNVWISAQICSMWLIIYFIRNK